MSFEVFLGRGAQFTMTLENGRFRQGEQPFNETNLLSERESVAEAIASAVIEQLSDSASTGEVVQNPLNATVVETVASAAIEQVSDPASIGEIVQNSLSTVTSVISSLTNSTSTGFSNLTKNFTFTHSATRALNSSEPACPTGTIAFLPTYSVPNATNTTLESSTALVKRVTQAETGKNILLLALGALGFIGITYSLYRWLFSSSPKPASESEAPASRPEPKPKREAPLRVYVQEIPKEIMDW